MSILEIMTLTENVKVRESINNKEDSDYSKQMKLENAMHKTYVSNFGIARQVENILINLLIYLGRNEIIETQI